MTSIVRRLPAPTAAYSLGWVVSLILHATLAVGAVVLTQRIQVVADLAPFTWNVAMVAATPHRAASTPPSSPSAPPATSPTLLARRLSASSIPSDHSAPVLPSRIEQSLEKPLTLGQDPQPPLPNSDQAAARAPGKQAESYTVAPEPADFRPSRHAVPSEPLDAPIPAEQIPLQTIPQAGSSPAGQVAAANPQTLVPSTRPDYGWLSETILRRVESLKQYPADARLDHAEGKVILKAIIRDDGAVDDVEVYKSSGYQSLDRAAVELLKRAAPFELPRPLGQSKLTVKIPLSYRLE